MSMVDFRVDDGFPQHPKTLGMSHEAMGVWVVIGCHCARYLTDGVIENERLATITKRQKIIDELAARHLIEPIEGGWQMVDWAQYQRTKKQVLDYRERLRIRQERWRARQKESGDE